MSTKRSDMPKKRMLYISFVYGHNKEAERKSLCDDIIQISASMDDAWALIRDFNAILY